MPNVNKIVRAFCNAPPPSSVDLEAAILLKDALFLRMHGERPAGAPQHEPEAETWRGWDRRCEAFLRRVDA